MLHVVTDWYQKNPDCDVVRPFYILELITTLFEQDTIHNNGI